MLIIACLLLVPLVLRYATSWHMNHLRLRLLREDEALRDLHQRFTDVREQLIDDRRRLRQYEARIRFVGRDIRQERQRLEALRTERTGAERLAA